MKNCNKELLNQFDKDSDPEKQNKRFTTNTATTSDSFQKPTPSPIYNNKNLINNIFVRNSIRFFINNTFINGFNDRNACYKVGDIIPMGLTNDEPKELCRMDMYGEVANVPCFYSCKEKDIQSKDLQVLLRDYVVKATFEIFSTLLSVRNPDKTLKLQNNPDDKKPVQCTRGIYIPEELYTKGKNDTDHYVFITARPTQDSMTIAFSLICDAPILYIGTNEWIYDRPRVSILNFNPNYFSKILESQSKWVFNQYMRVGIHEMVHSLGFSALLYDSFVNPDTGIPYRFDSNQIAKVIQEDGTTPLGRHFVRNKSVIATPTIVKFTKNYFNCSTAQGFELEDYGGAGTAGSHWEKRSADEEIMTGYISQTLPLSRLTLTFLYDTGWYIPNFSFSENHQWGKGLGCDWLKNCDPKSWDLPGYYCTNFREMDCTANRMGKGICHLVRYTESLPAFYQHFNSTSIGGSNRASDYCPFYQTVHSVNCPKCGYCSNTEEKPNKAIKEEFGFDSRCFNYNIIYIANDTSSNSACWINRCNNERKILEVKIDENWYDCVVNKTIQVPIDVTEKETILLELICPKKEFDICDF
ncbi:hypothetical protein DICPUDRAFT_33721 [Dictyostelium purpureum]|uniref:Leishmanolysin-like peptidase n=1 Tax=Dictyostelium purpureum TaxID=5786 RepID=F0ZLF0_DICPU|nr:uncharacterized protein DICPUDRAFT_33721 [Dictyostelium purpureum]EGC35257.1 hypothetical protein DICPUDRAFT_33721 [Dictyostelium purpureum]|eukprot:XP_003288244.1 hypothetical protein DICPUDRAFT_33721 [Dictyostelium purpureum]